MNNLSQIFKNEVKKIMNYFNVGKYDIVIKKSKILLRKNPQYIGLYNMIGISHQKEKRYEEAINIFLQGLRVDPVNYTLILNLANSYKAQMKYDLAEINYKKILTHNPTYVLALLNYGNLKNDLNQGDEAIELYDRALKIDDKNFTTHFNKAFMLQAIGRFGDSIFHAKKCLELNINFTPADALLSKMLNYKEDDWHLKSMLKKIVDQDLNIPSLYNLYFAIGNAYEKIGSMSLSMENIHKANEIKRRSLKFNIEDEINLMNSIKKAFKNLDLNSLQIKNNNQNKNIIFILGMPRSGTTLVEQIISSHQNVFGAGEVFTLATIIKDSFYNDLNPTKELNIDLIKNTNFKEWQKKYYDSLVNFGADEKYLTDKNLLNFLWIGFIKILFPNAKIIHCHRNPIETCLSIYKNNFPGSDLGWTYNQNELGTYYNLYKDLMKFWHELLPGYIYDIKYENLIQNQQEETRLLIEACGLKWDDSCLNFHQNKRPIKTLSVTQARKKIYKTSLNLSENYKSELKELFSILSK